MNITLTIEAPELVAAVNNLANSLGASPIQITEPKKAEPKKQTAPKEDKPVKKEPKPDPKPVEEPVKEVQESEETSAVSIEDVRAVLSQFSAKSAADKARDLLINIGGSKKLSDVDEAKYPELIEAANEELANL